MGDCRTPAREALEQPERPVACGSGAGGLEDVRIHDLRHSFASRALALGESLTMIGKLLGHRKVQTTARYAHLARESVKTSAARVAESIAADMEEPPTAPVADRTV